MKEVGRAPGRSKDATLAMLKRELGGRNMAELDRDRIIRFGRARAEQGAGCPTDDELAKLIAHFEGNPRQIIPMGRIIKFAVATAMRQEEICRVTWSDLNTRTKMLTIRDRKDPREKKGNDQRIPLLAVSGFDALALIEEQRAIRGNEDDRIFPYHHKSAGTAWPRRGRA